MTYFISPRSIFKGFVLCFQYGSYKPNVALHTGTMANGIEETYIYLT